MYTKNKSGLLTQMLVIILLAGSLLLAGCSTTLSTSTPDEPTSTSAPIATVEPTATVAALVTEIPDTNGLPQLILETGSIASGFQTETIPAVTDSVNFPYWEVLPEYSRVTLEDYPIQDHLMKPQIFIYPVAELRKINEGASTIITSLQTLIQSPQEIENMPFLPLFNAAQMMHTNIQYLDFKNGMGLRYLTQFTQGIVPINNYELIYTYQGLTSDGNYYVAAVLPVNHPSLPVNDKVTESELPEFANNFKNYVKNVVNSLNPQAANSFTPDLTLLDAMMSSMEIK
ncbi:MAG: hypothetical protein CVU46_17635 [Chloroflexi bacterium HGW-Chloroflexi-8]|jgi:uncharacterized protein YceK|nr:MAG: hypothetical protein CVU46_17635 [Chloroflexi bacterium HGW-Chloroflexi-8]